MPSTQCLLSPPPLCFLSSPHLRLLPCRKCVPPLAPPLTSQHRDLAIVLFRKKLSISLWNEVDAHSRESIKAAALVVLQNVSAHVFARKVADAIGAIASVIFGADPPTETWPQLLPTVFALLRDAVAVRREAALALLSSLVYVLGPQIKHQLKDFADAALHGLNAPELNVLPPPLPLPPPPPPGGGGGGGGGARTPPPPQVRVAGLEVAAALMSSFGALRDVLAALQQLVPPSVSAVNAALTAGDETHARSAIDEFISVGGGGFQA
jgi:hypothetical protein